MIVVIIIMTGIPRHLVNELFRSRTTSGSSVECDICISSIVNVDELMITLCCGHSFHKSCITEWGQNRPCPCCRHSNTPDLEPEDRNWYDMCLCIGCHSSVFKFKDLEYGVSVFGPRSIAPPWPEYDCRFILSEGGYAKPHPSWMGTPYTLTLEGENDQSFYYYANLNADNSVHEGETKWTDISTDQAHVNSSNYLPLVKFTPDENTPGIWRTRLLQPLRLSDHAKSQIMDYITLNFIRYLKHINQAFIIDPNIIGLNYLKRY
jgi:hypothetical protein